MTGRTTSTLANLLTFIVWLATAAFTLYAVYLLHDLFFTLYARFGGKFRTGEVLRMLLLTVFSLLAIVYIIGSGGISPQVCGQDQVAAFIRRDNLGRFGDLGRLGFGLTALSCL